MVEQVVVWQIYMVFLVDIFENCQGIMLYVDLLGVLCEKFDICVQDGMFIVDVELMVFILVGLWLQYGEVWYLYFLCIFVLSFDFDVLCIDVQLCDGVFKLMILCCDEVKLWCIEVQVG